MSQEPSVLLVDLPEQGVGFAQALNQVGRPSVAIVPHQIQEALKVGRPLGIVALSKDVSDLASAIRDQNYPNQLPFFVLQSEAPGSIRPPLPEVTAVVPEGIEPGILALRIQTALQQAGGPRPRQATVLGMGSMSKPQALPSQAPSKPPQSKAIAHPPPVSEVPQASKKKKVAPSSPEEAPAEVPWDTSDDGGEPTESQRAQALGISARSVKAGVVSSAPPLPEIGTLTPSAPNIPDAAPLPTEGPSIGSTGQEAPSTSPEAVSTHPPVALASPETQTSSTFDADAMAMKKPSWIPRVLVAAAVLGAVGVGAFLFSNGGNESEPANALNEQKESPAASTVREPTEPKPKPAEAVAAPSAEPETTPEPEVTTGEAAYFKIESPVEMESCEKVLGKTPSDFQAAKKWQASQAWKMARKSLMAGTEDRALEHMCEATFIDASGPATVGLAKYYLGKRALEQAHTWAQKAVEAAAGANSKRAAQQVLGDVLSQMGKIDEARKLWLESFNLTEDQTDRLSPVVRNFINAAVKARKGGDPALAEQLLRRATAFEPDNVNASALLAATLLDNGEKGLAKLWAERALKKKPGLDMAQEVLKSVNG